jgi:hypothetical protein
VDLKEDTNVSVEHTASVVWADVLKMKAVCCSKTLLSTCKSTWHYNPEDQHQLFDLTNIMTMLRYDPVNAR